MYLARPIAKGGSCTHPPTHTHSRTAPLDLEAELGMHLELDEEDVADWMGLINQVQGAGGEVGEYRREQSGRA